MRGREVGDLNEGGWGMMVFIGFAESMFDDLFDDGGQTGNEISIRVGISLRQIIQGTQRGCHHRWILTISCHITQV